MDDLTPYTKEELADLEQRFYAITKGQLQGDISPLTWPGVERLLATARAGLSDTKRLREAVEPFIRYGAAWFGPSVPDVSEEVSSLKYRGVELTRADYHRLREAVRLCSGRAQHSTKDK